MVGRMIDVKERQQWLRVLARAKPDEIDEALGHVLAESFADLADSAITLREPEVGTALVTGRVGATGAPFGVGEMTVTRCVVQVGGAIGIGYVRGRAPQLAQNVALTDALLQTEHHDRVHDLTIKPLEAAQSARATQRVLEVGSSRVQFVTMVRGD